jgi:hypothetical protein
MLCSIIVPRQSEIIDDPDYLAECIRMSGHPEPHVFRTPEGKFIAWKDDMTCDCCAPDEDDRCYAYWEITAQEVEKLGILV